jgi:hypothetical protein
VIDSEQRYGGLSSAIRVFVLGFYRDRVFERKMRDRKREMRANITIPTGTTWH